MTRFIPGIEFCRRFYCELVRPLLDAQFPGLEHSAGLIGPGSEVLGLDTEMSTDHSWGPRLLLFLSSADHARWAARIREALAWKLPPSFIGHPTHFEAVPGEPGSWIPAVTTGQPINHLIRVETLEGFLQSYAALDLDRPMSVVDWLRIPEQVLLSLSQGAVYYDGLHVLEPMRRELAYYPHSVWLYLLSAQWQRIGQEEPFVGRAGIAGDDLGSAVIAARLVRDVMRLAFLLECRYAPYPKWFGSAFSRLACASRLSPSLEQALRATTWQDRELHLGHACERVACLHNGLGITEAIPDYLTQFHDRPFRVIQGGRIAEAIWHKIEDPDVLALPFGVGKVDQWVDSTDVLSHASRCKRLEDLFRRP